MNLSDYCWYFKSALTPRFCDEVIKYALAQKEKMAITGSQGRHRNLDKQPLTKDEIKDLKRNRNSNVVWLDDAWIYKEIHPFVHEANRRAGWNFNWDRSEPCQFTKYKFNQYYDWHCDGWNKPYTQEGSSKGKIITEPLGSISVAFLKCLDSSLWGGSYCLKSNSSSPPLYSEPSVN